MLNIFQKKSLINSLIEKIELPEYAYERAKDRYDNIGQWFDRDDSILKDNDPHIFPQGSFCLGTATRPVDERDGYDLDLACKLRAGITKGSHTQKQLKELVGEELGYYRQAQCIKEQLEPKHRCWRLEYHDKLNFHMDIVPCIPADEDKRQAILESMIDFGIEESIAGSASQLTVSITDDRHKYYDILCDNWEISNPEGYAQWFKHRMLQERRKMIIEARVDPVPLYMRKSPLQQTIQILKRHRDQMFKDKDKKDLKPISIIISTLAARAYNGESDPLSSLENILSDMENFIKPTWPRVPNPVDPSEDFADRWHREDFKHLELEKHFKDWLFQAKIDFRNLYSETDPEFISEFTEHKFSVKLSSDTIMEQLGLTAATTISFSPKSHSITSAPKPWQKIN